MLSVCLLPDAQTLAQLTRFVLSRDEHPSPAHLEPHINILSGISLTAHDSTRRLQQWAQLTPALTLQVMPVEYIEMYYRCLFFTNTEAQKVHQHRQELMELLDTNPIDPYVPHLSFLHGAAPRFSEPHTFSDTDPTAAILQVPFVFSRVCLIQSDTLDQWTKVAEFSLKGTTVTV